MPYKKIAFKKGNVIFYYFVTYRETFSCSKNVFLLLFKSNISVTKLEKKYFGKLVSEVREPMCKRRRKNQTDAFSETQEVQSSSSYK